MNAPSSWLRVWARHQPAPMRPLRYARSPGPAWHANLLPDLDRVRVVYFVESRELLHRQVISRRDLREGLAASDSVPYRGDVERGRLHV